MQGPRIRGARGTMDTSLIQSMLDAVPVPALMIDNDAWIAFANGPAVALFGNGIVGRHYMVALRQPAVAEAIAAALSQAQPAQVRYSVQHSTHEESYRATITPVSGTDWHGALCAFVDLTEQERTGQMRRDFVANVSHELRTPLTALLGFIETLKGAARKDTAARDRFLNIMEREAGRMNRLVSDLLVLSGVEAEERQRPSAPVDIAALASASVAALAPMAKTSGAEMLLTGAGAPLYVTGDADQLTQVFQNLIENALKYGTPGQTVRIELSRESYDPGLRGPAIQIFVRDQGPGIEPYHLPRLTERFYRVDPHRSREKGGTGLGLAIVKHIVSRHRGRLRIESEKGKGSCFCVILPAA